MSLVDFTLSKSIEINGEMITISPVKVKNITPFAEAIYPLFDGGFSIADIEGLKRAISLTLDKPMPWLDDLYLGDFLDLLYTVIEVNQNFFEKRGITEKIAKITGMVTEIIGTK